MSSASVTSQGLFFDHDNSISNVLDHDRHRDPEPRNIPDSDPALQSQHRSSTDSNFLSPYLSRVNSDSLSPSIHNLETSSDFGQYHSDYSDLDEDPFFGADFNTPVIGTPSFLDDQSSWNLSVDNNAAPFPDLQDNALISADYPMTPEKTVSVHTVSPHTDQQAALTQPSQDRLPSSVSPRDLQKAFQQTPLHISTTELTPSQSGSGRSSEDGLAPAPVDMKCQSPLVTVSMWDKDNSEPTSLVERTLEDSPTTVRTGIESAGDLISFANLQSYQAAAPRDAMGEWQRNPRPGLEPSQRPVDEVTSINEVFNSAQLQERNKHVGKWLIQSAPDPTLHEEKTAEELKAIADFKPEVDDDIPLGNKTENRHIPGQTYYSPGRGGQMKDEDLAIIYADRNWADAPVLHPIKTEEHGRHQPQSSQAAIERFEKMCRDTDSILSRSATWGTRRRSLPSVIDFDVEGVTSGNFLKKLSLSRGSGERGGRQGSIFGLKDLRGLVRRTSAAGMRKRTRSGQDEALFQQQHDSQKEEETPLGKRDSITRLSPTSRTSSWGKKQNYSINNAIGFVGQKAAVISTHPRSLSISHPMVTPAKSPRSSLSVKNIYRPRSRSELTKPSSSSQSPANLVGLWRKNGGPPVAAIAKTYAEPNEEEAGEEEEEEEMYEESDLTANPNIIDSIMPNFSGFQQHIQILNQTMPPEHAYLVDRIAQYQVVRYKQLLNARVKHLGLGANCPSGSHCSGLGGSVTYLDSKGDAKGLDPLATSYDEEDMTPTEAALNQESFPADIPLPPTQHLPAEFECQLCFQKKKFQKPSDWTKHVHEDVQPFVCTWDKCRDPKIFKRKADWLRHENEGHRHLEWWTCDVDDCRHVCYRRDNFLQHLVREHKFPEPKIKTKAAMKKTGNLDVTWQKVEQCHVETEQQPQEEPCRFCGKTFPTWKKLTIHLAKHMEQISLPVLRLVAVKAKTLAADTIISPVQELPPRQDLPTPVDQNIAAHYPTDLQQIHLNSHQQHSHQQQQQPQPQQMPYATQQAFMYPVMPPGSSFQQSFYSPQFDSMNQTLHQHPALATGHLQQGFTPDQHAAVLPVTTSSYIQGHNSFIGIPPNELEQYPPLNALGLQNSTVSQMTGPIPYDSIIDPSSVNGSPFSGHDTLSTYSHSPHMNTGNVDGNRWDDRHPPNFL